MSGKMRTAKRILALLLVIFMIIPQSISALGVRADEPSGSTVTVSAAWSGDYELNISMTGFDSASMTINSFSVSANGVELDKVSDFDSVGKASFSTVGKVIRKGDIVSFSASISETVKDASDTDVTQDVTVVFPAAGSIVVPKNAFTVDYTTMGFLPDHAAKSITVTAESGKLLTDYGAKVKAYKISGDSEIEIGGEVFSNSASVTFNYDDSGKVGKKIIVKILDSADNVLYTYNDLPEIPWKAGDFTAAWNDGVNGPSVTISRSDTNFTGILAEVGGNLIIKTKKDNNDVTLKEIAVDKVSGAISLDDVRVNKDDVLTAVLSVDEGKEQKILSDNSFTATTNNYFTVTVNKSPSNAPVVLWDGNKTYDKSSEGNRDIYVFLKKDAGSTIILKSTGFVKEDFKVNGVKKEVVYDDVNKWSTYTLDNPLTGDVTIDITTVDVNLNAAPGKVYPEVEYEFEVANSADISGVTFELKGTLKDKDGNPIKDKDDNPIAVTSTLSNNKGTLIIPDGDLLNGNETLLLELIDKNTKEVYGSKSITVEIGDISEVLNSNNTKFYDSEGKEIKPSEVDGARFTVNKYGTACFDFSHTDYKYYKTLDSDNKLTSWIEIPTTGIVSIKYEKEGLRTIYVRSKYSDAYAKGEVSVLVDTEKPNITKAEFFIEEKKVADEDEFTATGKKSKTVYLEFKDVLVSEANRVDSTISGMSTSNYYVLKNSNGEEYKWDGKVVKGDITGTNSTEIIIDCPIFVTDISVEVHLFDKAGNEYIKSYPLGKIVTLNINDDINYSVKPFEEDTYKYYLNKKKTISFEIEGDSNLGKIVKDASKETGIALTLKNIKTKKTRSITTAGIKSKKSEIKSTIYTLSYEAGNDEDGIYELTVSAGDDAGNFDTVSTVQYVVDNTVPEIEYNKLIEDLTSSDRIINEQKTNIKYLQLVASVKDVYLNTYKLEVVKATGENGESIVQNDYIKMLKDDLNLGKLATGLISEGTYNFTYTVTDKAGNSTTRKTGEFIYDVTKPVNNGISIDITGDGLDKDDPNADIKYEDYQYFDNKDIVVSVNTKDVISGVKDIKVTVPEEYIEINSCNFIKEYNYDSKKYEITGIKFNIEPKKDGNIEDGIFKGKIGVTVTDNAGNILVGTISNETFKGIIAKGGTYGTTIDLSTNPVASKVFVEAAGETEYYNNPMNVGLSATDTIAGIREIIVSNKDNGKSLKKYDTYTQKTKITMSEKSDVPISAEGEYRVEAELTDNAGNKVTSNNKRIIIDTTLPRISSDVKSVAKEFNNSDVSVTVSILEKYMNDANTEIRVYNNGSLERTINGGFSNTAAGNENHTLSIPFGSDGKYYFTVTSKDKAGNDAVMYDSRTDAGYEFTVDKTRPRISLTYNNNNANNSKYYNAERIGTITIDEHNFDPSSVNVRVTVSDSSDGVGVPGVSGWSTGSDTHSASIPFVGDATYEINITATDQAGNAEEAPITDSFIVDCTAPEIVISNVEENALYSNNVAPNIEVTDRNYDTSATKITLESSRENGKAGKSLQDSYTRTSLANGENFRYANFKKDAANDDYYLVKAVATDLAGNSSEQTVGFMVNRFGSWFTIDDYTSELVSKKYTNLEGGENIVIQSHNLAEIKESKVYYTVGEDTNELKENEDYKVSKSKEDEHWNVLTYTINNDIFTDDGEYNIVVSTKDSEGNVADNESKEVPVTFVIDRIIPEYYITGVEDGQDYEDVDTVNATIEVYDNIGVSKAIINCDGVEKEYTGEELDKTDNKVVYENLGKGEHTITVKVFDLASNESENSNPIKFSVGMSSLEKTVSHLWWVFLIAAIAIIAVAVFIVVIVRKKRQ